MGDHHTSQRIKPMKTIEKGKLSLFRINLTSGFDLWNDIFIFI